MSAGRGTAVATAAGLSVAMALCLTPISQASTPAQVTPRSAADGSSGSFSWIGGPNGIVYTLALMDDTLYVGGEFGARYSPDDSYIMAWADDTWRQVGGGMSAGDPAAKVLTLAAQDDTLYAAGSFPGAIGIAGTFNIAAFADGSWRSMKSNDSVTTSGTVNAMAVIDDTLYATGTFLQIGGVSASKIAQWADDTWTPLLTGLNADGISGGNGSALASIGDTLYVAGTFTDAEIGIPNAGRLAAWADDTFQPLGAGVDDTSDVAALAVQGSTLYAGGTLGLPLADRTKTKHVAAWADGEWRPLGVGLDSPVSALAVDDTHGLVYAAGVFPNPRTPGDDTLIAQAFDTGTSEWIALDDSSATSPFDFSNLGPPTSFAIEDSVVYIGLSGIIALYPDRYIARWTWEAPTAALGATSGTAGAAVPITGWSLIGVDSVTFGTTAAAISRDDSTSLTATVPNLAPGTYTVTVSAVGGTTTAGTYTVTNSPTPQAPGAPTSVIAEAGNASATVAWQAPGSPGSYPVTSYQVEASPGGQSCLTSALTCTVAGLANGTSYTFEVRALSGAGWGPWSSPSNPVTPSAAPAPSILITGTREGRRVTVTGSTTGFGMGGMVTAQVRTERAAPFVARSTVLVDVDGDFNWSRQVALRKTLWVYFTGGGAQSNILRLRP